MKIVINASNDDGCKICLFNQLYTSKDDGLLHFHRRCSVTKTPIDPHVAAITLGATLIDCPREASMTYSDIERMVMRRRGSAW